MAERGKSEEPAYAEARDIAEYTQAVVRYLRRHAEHSQSAELRVLADLRALIEKLEQDEEGEGLEASETPIHQAVHRDRGGEGVLARISEVFGEPGEPAVQIRLSAEGVDPSHVNVVVEAEPAQARAEAGEVSVKTTEALPSVSERDAPVQMDDAYYDEVRQAVGRGAPSVLVGTSTRSLERNLGKLKAVQQAQAAIDRSSSSASSPERADLTEILRASVAAAKAGRRRHPKKD